MKLHPVESEMLSHAGYDEATRTLGVIFHTGERYQYFGVPPSKFKQLMDAESKGQYMHKHIIGKYAYERVY